MTSDEKKISIFEEDPCGMVGFNSLHYEGNQVPLVWYAHVNKAYISR